METVSGDRCLRRLAGVAAVLAVGLASAACLNTKNYLDPAAPRYIGDHTAQRAAPPSRPSGSFRIVTFNISYGTYIGRALQVLRESEPLLDFDALALQEMDARGVDRIARELGVRYVYFPSAVHPQKKRDFGCAILSPWPLENPLKLVLPHKAFGTKIRRAVTAATVVRGDERFRFYSIHLPAPLAISAASRREQVRIVTSDARGCSEPVIVAGDFNSYGIGREFVQAGFAWVTKDIGPTLHNFLFRFRYDHIFVRSFAGTPISSAVGVVEDNKKASDHRRVWAVIDFNASGAQTNERRVPPTGS